MSEQKNLPYPDSYNSWQIHVNMVFEIDEYIKNLNIKQSSNALWDILHIIIWHKGIDPVRWIDWNKELIKKISSYKYLYEIPEDIKTDIQISLRKMRRD